MAQNVFTKIRAVAAVTIGLVGAVFIWVVVPLNNYYLNSNIISDSYIPEIAVALLALVVLGVNPLLGLVSPAWRLTRRQLALSLGIWLMACVLPGQGLLATLPYSLANFCQIASLEPALAEAYTEMALPEALFPDRVIDEGETPVSDGLLGEHKPGDPIPWRAWMKPLAAWGPFIFGTWLMMIGMGLMVFPQWRDRERLTFPLLAMYAALIDPPEPGRRVPPVLRSRLFWAGALTVLLLHSFNGLNSFTHGNFPGFPFDWNFWQLFQDGVWRHAPWTLRGGRIYFTLIGIVYFMPNRVSFSIWSGCIVFALYLMFKWSYFPTAPSGELEFKTGAWFAYALAIIWLGRMHWAEVGRAMFSPSRDGTVARDRSAGWMFTIGMMAMFFWFLWVGLPAGAAFGFTIFGMVLTLLVTRVVCEAGMPLLNFSPMLPYRFISMFPMTWWSTASIFMGGIVGILFNYGARICAAVMCSLGMGLDPERSPRDQKRFGYLLLLVLVAGLFVAGMVHFRMAYGHETALDGKSRICDWGAIRLNQDLNQMKLFRSGATFTPGPAARWPFFVGGVIVATGLQAGCMAFPRWPIHPIALLFVGSRIGDGIWPSIFLGWLIKTLLTTYGGARGYRTARPLFLGLVLGEIFAVIVWTIVPIVLVLSGTDPAEMGSTSILMGS